MAALSVYEIMSCRIRPSSLDLCGELRFKLKVDILQPAVELIFRVILKAQKQVSERRKKRLTKAKIRSAITRGRFVLADIDHRSAEMRRLRDLLDRLLADLGGDQVSHAKRVLAGSACMLTLLRELKQADFARKDMVVEDSALDSFMRLANTEGRAYERLGLERQMKDVTGDTLDDIAAEIEAENARVGAS